MSHNNDFRFFGNLKCWCDHVSSSSFIVLFLTRQNTFIFHAYLLWIVKKTIAIWSCSAYTSVTFWMTFAEKKNCDRSFWFHQKWNEWLWTNCIDSYFAFAFAQKFPMNMATAVCLWHCRFLIKLLHCTVALPLFRLQFQNANNMKTLIRPVSGLVEYLCYRVFCLINKMFFVFFFFFKKQQQNRHLFKYLHTSLIVSSTHVDMNSTQFSRWRTKKKQYKMNMHFSYWNSYCWTRIVWCRLGSNLYVASAQRFRIRLHTQTQTKQTRKHLLLPKYTYRFDLKYFSVSSESRTWCCNGGRVFSESQKLIRYLLETILYFTECIL